MQRSTGYGENRTDSRGRRNASEALNVTVELVKRGYTEKQIAKIWGGNLLRVMEEVEKASRK